MGRNNHLWYYRLNIDGTPINPNNIERYVTERQYLGTVDSVQMTGNYAAVLAEGKVQLHPLDSAEDESGNTLFIYLFVCLSL